MQLLEVDAERAHVIERIGPPRVAGDLHALPARQAGVDLAFRRVDLGLDRGQLRGHIDVVLK